jgi:pyroglutamyl-peptidase
MGMSRPPRLLICGFGPFPEAPDNPAAKAVQQLDAQAWSPAGAEAAYFVLPTIWAEAPEEALVAAWAHDADAILLVGVAVSATSFRVETLARNQASRTHADAEGRYWPSAVIDPAGPQSVAVTAPVEAMLLAVAALGLTVERSSDAGAYLCNFTLYRLLTATAAPPVGFLHVPPACEGLGLDQIERAIQAAAQAFAQGLR